MNGSVFKLNHRPEPLPEEVQSSGYRELLIARPGISSPQTLVDPDGNAVTLVPPGYENIEGVGVRVGVRDEEAFRRFYGTALQLEQSHESGFLCGDSVLSFERDAQAVRAGEFQAKHYRYLTIQIHHVDHEHAGILERGGEEGVTPFTIGDFARICVVRDLDGNWIEISQRKSLVGTLE